MRWWRNRTADTDGVDRQGEVVAMVFIAQHAVGK